MCDSQEGSKKIKCKGKCKLCRLKEELNSPDDLIRLDFIEWLSQNGFLKDSEDIIWNLYKKK